MLIAAWRGPSHATHAAELGHEVISCPHESVYLDYRQSADAREPSAVGPVLTLADIYAFDPMPEDLDEAFASNIIGGQANLWTEHVEGVRRIDYMLFPRLCALADAVWRSGEQDLSAFTIAMDVHLRRLDALGVEYRPQAGPRPWQMDDVDESAQHVHALSRESS